MASSSLFPHRLENWKGAMWKDGAVLRKVLVTTPEDMTWGEKENPGSFQNTASKKLNIQIQTLGEKKKKKHV